MYAVHCQHSFLNVNWPIRELSITVPVRITLDKMALIELVITIQVPGTAPLHVARGKLPNMELGTTLPRYVI